MLELTTSETILVVDDSEPLCDLVEVILVRAGYHVLTATSGAEALRHARRTPRIDLLLTDLEMPGMRGDELATRFNALHPSAPVVFVSSSEGPIETPVPFAFLAKPFTIDEMRSIVSRALWGRASHETQQQTNEEEQVVA